MREERRWHLHGFRFVVHNKGFLVSISFSSVHLLQIRNMKKRLTIILKSSISGAELQSFSETKNVTCETKIDELPKHETTRTFLLTSFLSSFVMMILIGLPDFFTCKEKEAIYLAIFAMIIHHVRCEIKTKTLSKKYDTSFPLLQTLDSFLTFDAILLLKGDARCASFLFRYAFDPNNQNSRQWSITLYKVKQKKIFFYFR